MSFLLNEHQKGNFLILRRFNSLMGMSFDDVFKLEGEAKEDNAPYDAIFKKSDGQWATLQRDVVSGAKIRKDIDDFIAYERQRFENGCPF